jgi:S1-C subfamily serine protease
MIQVTGALLLTLAALATPAWAAAPTPDGTLPPAQAGADWRCARVNGEVGLNVRGGPGTGYAVMFTLPPGAALEADYASQRQADGYTWLPVRYQGREGWAILPRLDACPAPRLTLPTAAPVAINRDGVLDRTEIAQLARSVVLLAIRQNGRLYASGTGTIASPEGLILTSAHVVEGADEVAVGVLDDLNDPPQWRYLGDVVSLDERVDVALIAVRSDMDGRPLSGSLELPYMAVTLAADEVYRGDIVYIFGYPGIGDDYLVVTQGNIVSVENGTFNGQRMPVWYRTDAEIAPGNSGGLVVNGNGEFVGIPTFVQSEEQTGGRLGGIRPAQVALMAVLDDYQPVASSAAPAVSVVLEQVRLDPAVTINGLPGLALHVTFTLSGWQGRPAQVEARFFYDEAAPSPVINPAAPVAYRDAGDQLRIAQPLTPCCPQTRFWDVTLSIPYEVLRAAAPGTSQLRAEVRLRAQDDSWQETLTWETVRLP